MDYGGHTGPYNMTPLMSLLGKKMATFSNDSRSRYVPRIGSLPIYNNDNDKQSCRSSKTEEHGRAPPEKHLLNGASTKAYIGK